MVLTKMQDDYIKKINPLSDYKVTSFRVEGYIVYGLYS
jgi:hypothetical protein